MRRRRSIFERKGNLGAVEGWKAEAVKVVAISDGSVPRNAILHAFASENWCYASHSQWDVFEEKFKTIDIDGEPVIVDVKATKSSNLFELAREKNVDVFMTCFSVANPRYFENIRFKLVPEMQKHHPHAVIVLIGVKADLKLEQFEVFKNPEKKVVSSLDGEFLAAVTFSHAYWELSSFTQASTMPCFADAAQEVLRRRRFAVVRQHKYRDSPSSSSSGRSTDNHPSELFQPNSEKWNPFQSLAFKGPASKVWDQLEAGESWRIFTSDGWGRSLLHIAAEAGNTETVRAFLEHPKFDNNLTDARGMTGEDAVFENGVIGVVDQLAARRNRLPPPEAGEDPRAARPAAARAFELTVGGHHQLPDVDALNVRLLPAADFLAHGRLPDYRGCQEALVSANSLCGSDEVLALVYPWEGPGQADDEWGSRYKAAVKFLATSGSTVTHVWTDAACVAPDNSSPERRRHLQALPLAFYLASHVLLVPPRILTRGEAHGAPFLLDHSHLGGLARDGWSRAQACLAVLAGGALWVAFEAESHHSFQRVAAGNRPLADAARAAWQPWLAVDRPAAQALLAAWVGGVLPEPRSLLRPAVAALVTADQNLLEKVFEWTLEPRDCRRGPLRRALLAVGTCRGGGQAPPGADGMGLLAPPPPPPSPPGGDKEGVRAAGGEGGEEEEEERAAVLRVLLQALAYAMGFFAGYRPPRPATRHLDAFLRGGGGSGGGGGGGRRLTPKFGSSGRGRRGTRQASSPPPPPPGRAGPAAATPPPGPEGCGCAVA